jgi:hypothetical protein
MKVGDLVEFEFEDVYTGLVVEATTEHIKVLFQDNDNLVTYTREELEICWWEIISET